MKKTLFILSSALALVACQKNDEAVRTSEPSRITFAVREMKTDVSGTRGITEVTTENLSAMYVTATSGAADAQAQFSDFKKVEHAIAEQKSTSTYYWPNDGSNLNFFATNVALEPTVAATGVTVPVAVTDGDVVYATKMNAVNGSEVALTFAHAFARLADIKFYMASDDATATIDKVIITRFHVAGTMTMADGSTVGSTAGTAQEVVPSPATEITATAVDNAQSLGVDIDQLMVKDATATSNVALKVTYTVKKPGYEKQFTKTANVALNAGESSTVRCALTDDASPIIFTVTVTPWLPVNVDATLVED